MEKGKIHINGKEKLGKYVKEREKAPERENSRNQFQNFRLWVSLFFFIDTFP